MSYELGYFDELINRELQSPVFRKAITSKTNFEQTVEVIRLEARGVRKRMNSTIFESCNGEVTEYIYNTSLPL